jgi:primosomal protein N' (replication factor Y) (superfamily II helicase)
MEYRRQLRNPPFFQLARLVFSHVNDDACRRESDKLRARLLGEIDRLGVSGVEIIGPAPVFLHRLRGRYRWHLVLRGRDLSRFLGQVDLPRGWTVDVDPLNMLQ